MSGYNDEMVTDQGHVALDSQFLPKPFGPEAVVKKIREILDERVY